MCPQCRNKFWAHELVANQAIAGLVRDYSHMEQWIRDKQQAQKGDAAATAGGPADEERKGPPGSGRRRRDRDDDAARGDEGKENSRPSERGGGGSAKAKAAASSSSAASAQHTPRRQHAASPAAITSPRPPASIASPPPLLTGLPLKTPPRVSLKEQIAAASSSAPRNGVTPSAKATPQQHAPSGAAAPVARSSPVPTSAAASAGGSHSKHFSKQGFTKTAASPVPTSTTTHVPASTVAATKPGSSGLTAATKSRNHTLTQLFGDDGPPSSLGDSDSDIIEMDPAQFQKSSTSAAVVKLQPSLAHMQLVSPTPVAAAKPHAASRGSNGTASKPPTTLDGFFSKPAAAASFAPKKLAPAAAASSSSTGATSPAAIPAPAQAIDVDGDAMMLAADVTRLVQGLRPQDLPTQFQNLSALSSQSGSDTAMAGANAGAAAPTANSPLQPISTPKVTSAATPAAPAIPATSSSHSNGSGGSHGQKSPHIPPSTVSSLSPKIDHSPPPALAGAAAPAPGEAITAAPAESFTRDRSLPLSVPPQPAPSGSLSLAASEPSQLNGPRDLFLSLPPLEHAPLINIYSQLPVRNDAAAVVDSESQDMDDVDPVPQLPPRKSLATEVAALNAAAAVAPMAAAVAPVAVSAAEVAPVAVPPTPAHSVVSEGGGLGSVASPATMTESSTGVVQMPSMVGAHSPMRTATAAAATVAPPSPVSPTQRTAVISAPPTPVAPPRPTAPVLADQAPLSPDLRAVAAAPPPAAVVDPLQLATLSVAPLSVPPLESAASISAAAARAIAAAPASASLVRDRPLHLSFSSLNPSQSEQLKAFCLRTQTKLMMGKAWKTSLTHVVCNVAKNVPGPNPVMNPEGAGPAAAASAATPGASAGVSAAPALLPHASRSLKYMQGVLSGCWVVSWDWVVASIAAGAWVEETPFEFAGDNCTGLTFAPRRSRLTEARAAPRLLQGLKISVNPDLDRNDPSVADLDSIIQLGGAVRVPTPECLQLGPPSAAAAAAVPTVSAALAASGITRVDPASALLPGPTYLLCRGLSHRHSVPSEMAALGARVGMIPLSVQWILDSISRFAIQDITGYRSDLTQEEKHAAAERKKAAAAEEAERARQTTQLPDDPMALLERLAS